MPRAKQIYSGSFKAPHSTRLPALRGGNRDFMKKLANNKVASCTNPMARTVQPNPAEGSSSLAMAGNMRPPVTDPAAVIPMAKERFFSKYVDTTDTVGQKRHPLPMPIQIPWLRISCQYCVAAEVVNMPSVTNKVPRSSMGRKKPASVIRPVKVPMKKVRKICRDPIHEMSDGGRSRSVV